MPIDVLHLHWDFATFVRTSLILSDGVDRLELEPLRLLGRSELRGPKLSSFTSPFVLGDPVSYFSRKQERVKLASVLLLQKTQGQQFNNKEFRPLTTLASSTTRSWSLRSPSLSYNSHEKSHISGEIHSFYDSFQRKICCNLSHVKSIKSVKY